MTPQQPLSKILEDAEKKYSKTDPVQDERAKEWERDIEARRLRKEENDRKAREANASTTYEHHNGNGRKPTTKKPEKKPRGRYGVVLAEVMENPNISVPARLIYGIIATSFQRDSETADLSISLLVKRSGVSKAHVKRMLKELQVAGVLQKLSTGTTRSKWKLGTYTA